MAVLSRELECPCTGVVGDQVWSWADVAHRAVCPLCCHVLIVTAQLQGGILLLYLARGRANKQMGWIKNWAARTPAPQLVAGGWRP